MADDTDSEESGDINLFKEPEGYYAPEKQHTIATHTTLTGQTLNLRLVGHNPLWVSIYHYKFVRTVTSSSLGGSSEKVHEKNHDCSRCYQLFFRQAHVISRWNPSRVSIYI